MLRHSYGCLPIEFGAKQHHIQRPQSGSTDEKKSTHRAFPPQSWPSPSSDSLQAGPQHSFRRSSDHAEDLLFSPPPLLSKPLYQACWTFRALPKLEPASGLETKPQTQPKPKPQTPKSQQNSGLTQTPKPPNPNPNPTRRCCVQFQFDSHTVGKAVCLCMLVMLRVSRDFLCPLYCGIITIYILRGIELCCT